MPDESPAPKSEPTPPTPPAPRRKTSPKPAAAPAEKSAAPSAPPASAPAAPKPAKPKAEPKAAAKGGAPAASAARPKPKKVVEAPKGTVVDVTGLVLGRAASVIAHRLLQGESIVVVNAEKSLVTGSRENVLGFYRANRARGSVRSGPHYPRYPDRIFRRTVRGMVPHLKTRGKEAMDRLHVFIGVPPTVGSQPRQSIEIAHPRPSLNAPLTLEEITRLLGARL